jgi:hypothetical protein
MLIPYHSNRLLPLVVAHSASFFYDTKINKKSGSKKLQKSTISSSIEWLKFEQVPLLQYLQIDETFVVHQLHLRKSHLK